MCKVDDSQTISFDIHFNRIFFPRFALSARLQGAQAARHSKKFQFDARNRAIAVNLAELGVVCRGKMMRKKL